MESATYLSISKAGVLRRQMDTISHNVANMNTDGFKKQQLLVTQHTVDTAETNKPYHFVTDLASRPDMSQGPMKGTGNDLDFALQGDGYFAVDTPSGERYTRAGNFRLNNERQLVNAQGNRVLDENDNPIEIPEDATDIEASEDGTLRANGEDIATLKAVRFPDDRVLEHLGHGLYGTDDPPLPADDVQIKQGFIEGANVDSVGEMSRMIEVHRSYSSVQSFISQEHRRMEQTINKLGQVQG